MVLLCCLSEHHNVHIPGPKQKQMILLGDGINGRGVMFYLCNGQLASWLPPYPFLEFHLFWSFGSKPWNSFCLSYYY